MRNHLCSHILNIYNYIPQYTKHRICFSWTSLTLQPFASAGWVTAWKHKLLMVLSCTLWPSLRTFHNCPCNCLIDLARAPAPTCPSPHHPFETRTNTHMATYPAHPLWPLKCLQHCPHPQNVKTNCWISLNCWNICLKLNIFTSCFEVKLEDGIHTRLSTVA